MRSRLLVAIQRRKGRLGLAASAFLLTAAAASASSVPVAPDLQASLSAFPASETEVTTTAPVSGEEAASSLSGRSVTPGELRQSRGLTLGETLKQIPGVSAVETGRVSKPVLHGMTGSRVLILYDGVRHESQSWGLDHGPELDPFAASHMTVVKGASGVRYGPDAIGGAVLIDPPRLPRSGPIRGELDLTGFSNGRTAAGSLRLEGSAGPDSGFGWRVQSSATRAGSLTSPGYVLDNTAARELNASGALGYTADTWGVEASFSRFDSTIGVFTGMVNENANQFRQAVESGKPLGVENYRFDYDIERPYQDVLHHLFIAKGFVNAGGGRLSVTLSHQIDQREEYDIVRANVGGPQASFDLRTWHGDAVWERSVGERLFAGVGISGGYQENLYGGRRFIPNYRETAGGVYGWLNGMGERWEWEAGLRADLRSVESFQRQRAGGASAAIDQHRLRYTTPSATGGFTFHLREDLDLKTSASFASRAPTVNELFVDGVSQTQATAEKGDVDLHPERSTAVSLDLDWRRPWLTLQTTAYGQMVAGFIFLAPELDANGQPVVVLTTNGGYPSFVYRQLDALFAGCDAEARFTPLGWLEFPVKLALIRAWNRTDESYLPFIPPDSVSAGVTFKAARLGALTDSFLALAWQGTARQDRVDLNADFAPPPSAYNLFSASIGGTWAPARSRHTLTWSLEMRNALDRRYRSYLSRLRYFADEPGRSVNARFQWRF